MRRWHRHAAIVALWLCGGGIAGESRAAEWSVEPSLGVKGEYNSNLILAAAPSQSTYGHWVSPALRFAGSTERFEVGGKTAVDFVGYYGGVDRSLTNLYFPVTARYRLDKDTLAFDGGFTRDNTLRGELLQTGVVLNFTQRNLWTLAPSWTHHVTERLSVRGTYNYSNATYESGAQLGLLDYEVHGSSVAMVYQLSEKDRLQVIGNYTNFSVPQANALRSNIGGAQVSLTHAFTESLSTTIATGPQVVSSAVQVGPVHLRDTQVVWVANGNIRKQWVDGYVELVGGREIQPSGFGLLIRTDRVGLNLAKDLTETLTLSLSGQVFFASAVTSSVAPVPLPPSRYVNVTPRLTWKFDQWWEVDVAYTYGRRDLDSLNQSGVAHGTTVMLTHYPPKLTIGR
jgi:hypothetical protein